MKLAHTLTLSAALVLGGTTLAAQQAPRPAQPRAPQAQGQEQRQAQRREARPQGQRAEGRRAQGPRGGMRGPAAARGALFRGIELSDAQRAQLRAIDQRVREQRQARMQELRAERGEARVRPDSATRARMRAEMLAQRQQVEGEIRGVLTPAQQQTFDANRARMAERASQMRERRAQRRDGARRPGRG